jgi:NAD(P)-dependent dehydrogenase (short-subunit alcohol dehydrogenase family)
MFELHNRTAIVTGAGSRHGIGCAEEIAAVICFLSSEEAGYLTGEDIDINCGSHMD